jgi:hypothetical protein
MLLAEKSLSDQGFFGETVSGIPKGSTGNRMRVLPQNASAGAEDPGRGRFF